MKLRIALLLTFALAVPSLAAPLLQGEVRHSEALPPVSDQLQVGAVFDEKMLSPGGSSNNWHQIPDWAAGAWLTTETVITSRKNFETGKTDNTIHPSHWEACTNSGEQKDAMGLIWSYWGIPSHYHSYNAPKEYSYHLRTSIESLSDEPNKIVIEFTGIDVRVDVATEKIMQVRQVESIVTQEPVSDGINSLKTSSVTFDYSGHPITEVTSTETMKRVAPFAVLDEHYGLDLKSLFDASLRGQA